MKYAFAAAVIWLAGIQNCIAQNVNTPNKKGPMGVEVNTRTGNLFIERTDIYIPARRLDLDISFSYNSFDFERNTGFGNGWMLMYDMKYSIDTAGRFIITWSDGREDAYINNSGQFISPAGIFDSLAQYQPGKYLLKTKWGLRYFFDNSTHKKLTRIQERNGNFQNLAYSDTLLTSITNGAGQAVTLQYTEGKLTSVTDANAVPVLTYTYAYDGYGNLTRVTDPTGGTYRYTYLVNGPMSSMTDKNGNVIDFVYYPNLSARELITCNARTAFSYDSATRKTTVIDFIVSGTNQTSTYEFNEKGYLAHITGNCCGYNITYSYDNNGNVIERKDANGNVYGFTYDNHGNLLKTTDPLNNVTSYTYSNDFNRIKTITDPLGNAYAIGYDAAGNVTHYTRPGNLQRLYTYNPNGDLHTITNEKNNTVTYTRDANGYPQKITLPLNAELNSVYDGRGNPVSVKDLNGDTYLYQHDSLNRIVKVKDPLNREYSFTYDKQGNYTSYTDPKGFKRIFSYDASNRLASARDAKGNTRFYKYNGLHNLESYTDELGNVTGFKYDNQNRVISITDAEGNGYAFSYDANGNIVTLINPLGNTLNVTYDKMNRITRAGDDIGSLGNLGYDNNGNITSYTNDGGAVMTFTYDNLNRITRITDPLGNSRKFSYDNTNKVQTITDRNNHVSSFTYNALNRITSYADNNNNQVHVQYDSLGNITRVTDQNGNSTLYEYAFAKRPIKMIYPDGSTVTFTYDNNDRIISKKLTDGTSITYDYDSTNRLLAKHLPNGDNITYSYDAAGRVLGATNSSGTVSFVYDKIGRLISESFNAHATFYSYNTPGKIITINYPNGMAVIKSYDKRLRMGTISSGSQLLATYKFNNNNQLLQKTLSNGVAVNYQYDFANRLGSIATNKTNLPSVSFQYDKEMNKTAVARGNVPESSETFSYDANNRLTAYTQGSTIQNNYTYDAVGNRTNYTVNNLNQYLGAGFGYDANGNRNYDGNFNMRYDAEGRKLVDSASGNVYRYKYDAFGRRVQKSFNGTVINTYYSGFQPIEERNGSDSLLSAQVFENAFMPLVRNTNNQKYFYYQNDMGSTEAITDSAGSLIERYKYDDFGKPFIFDAQNNSISSSSINNKILYTGQNYDYHNSSYSFHYRNYSPATGSFLQRDPIGYRDQMGLYQYVGNNPANRIDLLGLAPCPPPPAPQGMTFNDWAGQYSNVASWLQVYQSTEFFAMGAGGMSLSIVSEYINNTPLGLVMLPLNVAGTVNSAMDLHNNFGTNTASQNYNDVVGVVGGTAGTITGGAGFVNFVGAGFGTLVEGGSVGSALSTGLAEAGAALAPEAVAASPLLGAAVPVAGGLGLYGAANALWQSQTGETFSETGARADIPLFTDGVAYLNSGTDDQFGSQMWQGTASGLSWEHSEKYRRARQKVEENILKPRPRRPAWIKEDCPPNNSGGNQRNPNGPGGGDPFSIHVVISNDPNEIIGPAGVGPNKWVSINDRLPYTILFENNEQATAPAKMVKVVYPIDPRQDIATFQLSNFGFNNLTFTVPSNTNAYYKRLDVRDSLGLYVDITAGIDPVNNQAFWIFESIDPITLLAPSDPLKGFLLTPDSTRPASGHGFVNFSIKPIQTAHTRDTISAHASIIFDTNDTIPTNRAKNTIDALPPVSAMSSGVTYINPVTFRMSWHGSDDVLGSGIATYSLYMSINAGPYQLYRSGLSDSSLVFTGLAGSQYCFFTRAVDSTGNQEALKNFCQLSVNLGPANPLPVTWLYFTATRRNDDALLKWATATETNSKWFFVERSYNGIQYTQIGAVAAAGNSTDIRHYTYTDANIIHLPSKVIYYRLRQEDIDGHYKYSKVNILRVDDVSNEPIVNAFPNPFNQAITLQITTALPTDKTNSVELFSLFGTRLYRKEVGRQGSNTVVLNDLPVLPAGMYILKTTINDKQYTTKIMKN